MLDAFSTFRLKKPTIGDKVIAMAFISMRSETVDLRCTLRKMLDRVPNCENIDAILSVIDKRIKLLQGFTDHEVLDKHGLSPRFETDVNTNDTTEAKLESSAANQVSRP